ncbi:hypothetical protein [Pseudotenacibaculum haliotis]|uniref:Bacteriocin n=1 Tax=Pseudotenacibaculum haliotis TaxID=1862138 RepID=A0ABW5LQ51_9FLAO
MKKSILSIGKALNKTQQKSILGGDPIPNGNCGSYPTYPNLSPGGYTNTACSTTADCPPNPLPGAPYMCDFGCCLYAY